MTPVTRIAVVFGSGAGVAQSTSLGGDPSVLESAVADATGAVEVRVLSLGLGRTIAAAERHVELDGQPAGALDRLLRAIGAYALRRRFASFPLGRLLNSLGPVDQGRVFWRSVRRSPSALELLRGVDLVIAADLPGVKTAWLAGRRRWAQTAVYDHRSAVLGTGFHLPERNAG